MTTFIGANPFSLRRTNLKATTMDTIEFKLRGDFIALCDLLKLTGVVDSGGQGKHRIAEGEVTVDGRAEGRKTAKIRAHQTVQYQGHTILIVAA